MDSIKVIKKHGQPGGIPVITVYVDEEAPGEVNDIYFHFIVTGLFSFGIFTEDAEPYTTASFAKWLYDHGYTNATASNKRFPLTTTWESHSANKLTLVRAGGLASSNGTSIQVGTSSTDVSIVDGVLSFTTPTGQSSTTISNDIVYKLQG